MTKEGGGCTYFMMNFLFLHFTAFGICVRQGEDKSTS